MTSYTETGRTPLVDIGFRVQIAKWTRMHLDRFDVLEVTVDHYIRGGEQTRRAIRGVAERVPLVLHGVGLSIGTDVPLDDTYVDDVSRAIDDLEPLSYSEHLAWTKVPGIDLANLLPVPKTRTVAEMLAPKIHRLQERLPVRRRGRNYCDVGLQKAAPHLGKFDFDGAYIRLRNVRSNPEPLINSKRPSNRRAKKELSGRQYVRRRPRSPGHAKRASGPGRPFNG